MVDAPSRSTDYRVELYLRKDTYGTYDAQQRVTDRLDELEADGVLDAIGCDQWQGIQTMEYEHRSGALATYEEFQDWARHNDARLEPAFDQRIQSKLDRTETVEVVVFPVISLAIYGGERLLAVFPCSVDDDHFTVRDCLAAFESGNVDRFLSRFAPRNVDRTTPHLQDALV